MSLPAVLLVLLALAPSNDVASDACPIELPDAVSSFGAEGVGDALYVYSGHVGRTHAHSDANLSRRFVAITCDGELRELPMRDALQGTAVAAHGTDLIVAGGLRAFNATADQEEDLVSVREVRRFDTVAGRWEDLPPLPAPRSSHDIVVLGDTLWVVGGWTLRGAGHEPAWIGDMVGLDLHDPREWRRVAQPFQRRALAATHDGRRLVVVGGMDEKAETSNRVDLYDPEADTWTRGPDLPVAGRMKSFGVAAEHVGGSALVSTFDGAVRRLDEVDGTLGWIPVAELVSPRFFHELALVGDRLLAVGGSSRSGHLNGIETIDVPFVDASSAPAPSVTPGATQGTTSATAWSGFLHPEATPAALLPEAVAWRVEMPGYGQSAPVAWKDRVYVTWTEGDAMETQHLAAHRLEDGAPLWNRSLDSTERYELSDMIARAAPTPVVDAERVTALFGSGDLAAWNHRGDLLWRRDLAGDYGTFAGNHGVGASLVRTRDAIIVHIARKEYAYLLAVDPATGSTLWKTDREPGPGWTTPVATPDGRELVVSASGRLQGFDAGTGERRWAVEGLGGNNVSSPAVGDDVVAVSTTRSGGFTLLRRSDDGVPSVLWSTDFAGHYASPLLLTGCALVTNPVGGLLCLDPDTGEERWRHRLAGPSWATPLVDGEGNVVFVSEKGVLQVLRIDADGPRELLSLDLDTGDRLYGMTASGATVLLRSGRELLAAR